MNLTGLWHGFYEQGGSRHGIEMRAIQRGSTLSGTMRDHDTMMMGGIDAEEAERLRELFDSEGDGAEPEHITSLPADSTIKGTVADGFVEFVKRYRGAQRSEILIDGMHLQIEIPRHSVTYEGELDETGNLLSGQWRIARPGSGEPGTDDEPSERGGQGGGSGAFELRRSKGS